MDKPWFKLDPSDLSDRWWLYSSIKDVKEAAIIKEIDQIECIFIIKDFNANRSPYYRYSAWYKNDINRYLTVGYDLDWIFDKTLGNMTEGETVIYGNYIRFKVYDCKFIHESKREYCKILVRD